MPGNRNAKRRANKKKALKAKQEGISSSSTPNAEDDVQVFQGADADALLAQAAAFEKEEKDSLAKAREILGESNNLDDTDEKLLKAAQQFVDQGGNIAMAVGPEDFKHCLLEHSDSVFSVAMHPTNSNIAVSGSCDASSILWDLKTGVVKKKISDHKDSVIDVSFSFDGKYFATASMDGTINVYLSKNGKKMKSLDGPSSEINWMRWHCKGYVIAAGAADTTVWLWNAKSGAVMCCFAGHIGPVSCGEFTHTGKLLCSGSEDGSLYIWSPRTKGPVHHLKGDEFHIGPITALATHPNKSLLLTGSYDATANLISTQTGRVLRKLKGHQDAIESVGFSPCLDLCHTASLDGEIRFWDLKNGSVRASIQLDDLVIRARWHVSEAWLYLSCKDNTLRCYDGRTGNCLRIWRGHQAEIYDLKISSDGKTIMSGSDDSAVMIWNWDSHSTDWKASSPEEEENKSTEVTESSSTPSNAEEHSSEIVLSQPELDSKASNKKRAHWHKN